MLSFSKIGTMGTCHDVDVCPLHKRVKGPHPQDPQDHTLGQIPKGGGVKIWVIHLTCMPPMCLGVPPALEKIIWCYCYIKTLLNTTVPTKCKLTLDTRYSNASCIVYRVGTRYSIHDTRYTILNTRKNRSTETFWLFIRVSRVKQKIRGLK